MTDVCTKSEWTFSISLTDSSELNEAATTTDDATHALSTNDYTTPNNVSSQWTMVPSHVHRAFEVQGYVAVPNVLNPDTVHRLQAHLENVLMHGHYDRGRPPDKRPPLLTTTTPTITHSNESAITVSSAPQSHSGSISDSFDAIDSSQSIIPREATHPSGTASQSQKQYGHKKSPRKKGCKSATTSKQVPVIQMVNIHKADSLYYQLVTHPLLGQVVAELAGWTDVAEGYDSSVDESKNTTDSSNNECTGPVLGGGGTRVAQDQVWIKPPGSPALAFHQDTPYFQDWWEPLDIVTVWITLDDLDEPMGPLQYIPGSHTWNLLAQSLLSMSIENGEPSSENNDGTKQQSEDAHTAAPDTQKQRKPKSKPPPFFTPRLQSWESYSLSPPPPHSGVDPAVVQAARAAGIASPPPPVSMAGMTAGSLSIHRGTLWHGSDGNVSLNHRNRRGIGIHYAPAGVRRRRRDNTMSTPLTTTTVNPPVSSSTWNVPWSRTSDALNSNDDEDEHHSQYIDVSTLDFPVIWTPPSSIR
jgi:ectoine hydroxylase-related dioxygenase (phytanoyl-CoA dioxygenase family)